MEVHTQKEFEEIMRNCVIDNCNDPEDCHIKLDNLMCDLLKALGYEDGVKIFEGIQKWYS